MNTHALLKRIDRTKSWIDIKQYYQKNYTNIPVHPPTIGAAHTIISASAQKIKKCC